MYPSLQLESRQGMEMFSFGGARSGRLLYVKSTPAHTRLVESTKSSDIFMAQRDVRAIGYVLHRAGRVTGEAQDLVYSRKERSTIQFNLI